LNTPIKKNTAKLIYNSIDKWFFLHIPKNGGSSFCENIKSKTQKELNNLSISLLPIDESEYHNYASYFQQKYTELQNLTPVCLIRNPWSRCLSLFLFNLKHAEKHINESWAKCVHARLISEGFKKSWMKNGFFRDSDNMNKLKIGNRISTDNDIQLSWINKNTKYFRLEDQLNKFYEYINIQPFNNRLNVTEHTDYTKYYDNELKEEITTLYQKDIDTFNYLFY
jgi:hypothetical protein